MKTVNIYDEVTNKLLAYYTETCQHKLAIVAKSAYIVNEAGELITRVVII